MSDLILGSLLLQAIPFITQLLSPETSEVLSRLLEDTVSNLAAHSLAHIGTTKMNALREQLLEYAEKEVKPPQNHDLQRAFYASFLRATDVIYSARLAELGIQTIEVSWVAGLKRHILNKLHTSQVTTLSLVPYEKDLLIESRTRLRSELAACNHISQQELAARLPLLANTSTLSHIISQAGARNAGSGKSILTEILINSPWYQQIGEPLLTMAHNTLLDCIAAFFAEEIKSNERVRAVLYSEILAHADVTLEEIVTELRGSTQWLAEIASEVGAVREFIEAEFQKVFRVVDTEFLERQRHETLKPFLTVSQGDWALVIQGQSIPRDLTFEVTQRVLQPQEKAILQIIRGEPGCGKTTMLFQIGVALVKSGCLVLEVLPAASFAEFQFFLKRLTAAAKSRIFILIDDVFKNEDRALITDVLSNLGETLPITIIATTPNYEDRAASIRANNFLTKLPAVSPDQLTDTEILELKHIPQVAALSAKRFALLTASRRILVVLLQLTEGKTLDEILIGTARRLKKNHPKTYRAWGVIVTFGRNNLPVPSSLLDNYLKYPHFSDSLRINPSKIGSEGIIFPSSYPFKEGWSAGHQLIAKVAYEGEFKDRLRYTCELMLRSADRHDPEHVMFLARMLQILAGASASREERQFASDFFEAHIKKIRTLVFASKEAQAAWGSALLDLGQRSLAEECFLSGIPINAGWAVTVSRSLEKLGRVSKAIEAAELWLARHDDDTYVREFYLGMVERHGLPKQIKDALAQTAQWLSRHDYDSSVRRFWLGAVERRGDPEQIQDTLAQTADWLSRHDNDNDLRAFYLRVVERRGNPKRIQEALVQTAEWLSRHGDYNNVRAVYLGVLERHGESKRIQEALVQTAEWLSRHDADSYVREFYVGMLERHGDHEQVEEGINKTTEWLSEHEEDANVRAVYLGIVEHLGGSRQIQEVMGKTAEWLARHEEDANVRSVYLAMLERHANPEELVEPIKLTAAWLLNHESDENVRQAYISLVRRRSDPDKIDNTMEALEKWLNTHDCQNLGLKLTFAIWASAKGRNQEAQQKFDALFSSSRNWYQLHAAYAHHLLRLSQWEKAAKHFDLALKIHPRNQMAHEGKGVALKELGKTALAAGDVSAGAKYLRQAERHFLRALEWAGRQSMPVARFHASLAWCYIHQKRFEKALNSFETAIDQEPTHFSNYWGKGAALVGLGKHAEALKLLHLALSKAPQPLKPPASEEIPNLIKQCERALELGPAQTATSG